MSGRFVAPITKTCFLGVSPSSSVRRVLTTRADDSDCVYEESGSSSSAEARTEKFLGCRIETPITHQTIVPSRHQRIQLIEEDDAGRRSPRSLKDLADCSFALADVLQVIRVSVHQLSERASALPGRLFFFSFFSM